MHRRSRAERLERTRQRRRRGTWVMAASVVAIAVVALAGAACVLGGRPGREPASAEAVATMASVPTPTPASATSSGTVLPVEVPAVVGMSVEEAELLLGAAGLAVERVPNPPGETAPGTVLGQMPEPGLRVRSGSVVRVVYADPAATAVMVADALSVRGAPVVCIDPGHQAESNTGREPVGPGSAQLKSKVTAGAIGVVTGQREHDLALVLAFKVKERLERYGVTVVMTRVTGNVDISNAQRAGIANEAQAGLFLRIHADAHTNADVRGVSTLYPDGTEWSAPIRPESLEAASMVHRQVLASVGAMDRGVVGRSDLSGFNHARVPSVLVECGFLSNPVDDRMLADSGYQDRLADGIARGVLEYLGVTR